MKLPKTLYVKIEEDTDGTTYFIATEDMRGLVADINDTLTVGTYQLTETNTVETLLKISSKKKKDEK